MTGEALPDSPHRRPDGSKWPVPPTDGCTVDEFFTLDLPPHTEGGRRSRPSANPLPGR